MQDLELDSGANFKRILIFKPHNHCLQLHLPPGLVFDVDSTVSMSTSTPSSPIGVIPTSSAALLKPRPLHALSLHLGAAVAFSELSAATTTLAPPHHVQSYSVAATLDLVCCLPIVEDLQPRFALR